MAEGANWLIQTGFIKYVQLEHGDYGKKWLITSSSSQLGCSRKQYGFRNSSSLLRVTPVKDNGAKEGAGGAEQCLRASLLFKEGGREKAGVGRAPSAVQLPASPGSPGSPAGHSSTNISHPWAHVGWTHWCAQLCSVAVWDNLEGDCLPFYTDMATDLWGTVSRGH